MAAITVADVDAAIANVLKNQKYRLGDTEYTFPDLDKLRLMRSELIAEERSASNRVVQKVRFQGAS